jgi:hypothetical protein
LLQRLDVELLAPLPPLHQGRAGLGICPPASELKARWKTRQAAAVERVLP